MNTITSIVYSVKDLDAAKAIHTAVLGTPPTTDEAYYVGFNVGGIEIGLAPQGPDASPIAYVGVEDLDKAVAAVTQAGATLVDEPHDVGGGTRIATLIDTDERVGLKVIDQWGSTAEERRRRYPCDDLLPDPGRVLFRAVTIDAPPPVVFWWLCQLKLGPYSYDLIDNGARRSPRHLVPGADRLVIGEAISIFRLASFEPDEHLTLELRGHRAFGDLAMTYAVVPKGPAGTRLVVELLGVSPPGLLGRLLRPVLPLGDLIMMRRQLLNLKALAEATSPSEIGANPRPGLPNTTRRSR